MDRQHLAAITKKEHAINKTFHKIKQNILDLQKLLDSDDVCLVSEYTSRKEEFRSQPSQFQVTLPIFSPQDIKRKQLYHQLHIAYPLVDKPLSDKPKILTDIQAQFRELGRDFFYNVSCLSDEEIWTSGCNKIMKLYNLKGELLKSVQTKSGNPPADIAVTQDGDLVYADYKNSSINLVRGTQIHTLITLPGWSPGSLCSTSSGDLLVIIRTNNNKAIKVMRFTGSTNTQIIQNDDQGYPLYASAGCLS